MMDEPFTPGSGRALPLGSRTVHMWLSLLAAWVPFVAIQAVYAQKSSDKAPSTQTRDEDARVQANIDTVLAFYKAAANADFEQARQYVGYYYIEHDPNREDGIAGLQKALTPGRIGARQTFTIERLVGDGEYVILHAKLVPTMEPPPAGMGPPPGSAAPAGATGAGSPGAAPPAPQGNAMPPELRPVEVGEIFRLFDGTIVEHWKVIQTS